MIIPLPPAGCWSAYASPNYNEGTFFADQMVDYGNACAAVAVAAERERWKVAATAATQELCQCAPWTAGGQAFASLRQLIDGPNVGGKAHPEGVSP